jgi:hypothetical protein
LRRSSYTEPRITVQQALRFDAGKGSVASVAFNVSRSGTFIQCDGVPPPRGTEVLRNSPGGIGLELAMIEDGDNGRLWETWFVEETLLGFG